MPPGALAFNRIESLAERYVMDSRKSTLEVAVELIKATRQQDLRQAAMRNKGWAKVFRGFRPQAVSKELVLGRASEFAAVPQLLRELAEAFLKSAGVSEDGRLEERLALAADRTDLPEAVRAVCRQLAGEAALTVAGIGEGTAEPVGVVSDTEASEQQPATSRPRRTRAAQKPRTS